MKLSIVTTLYQSSGYIKEFYNRITSAAQNITHDYELIFVNDGSPDNSLEKIISLYEKDKKIKIIDLSRNFGHHKALMAGLTKARGDFVFLIDSDLEEDPELLTKFWPEICDKDIDVIYGTQLERKGGWMERWSGKLFYYVVDKLIDDIKYPVDTLTARLMTSRYVKKVIAYKETEYDLWSIFELAGHKTKSISCNKGYKGDTSYTFFKKMDMAIHIIVSTSKKPLLLIFYLGLLVSFMSFVYFIYLLSMNFIYDTPMGWTSIVVLLTFILGIMIFSLGIIGLYISVIFLESKKRPVTIKSVTGAKSDYT